MRAIHPGKPVFVFMITLLAFLSGAGGAALSLDSPAATCDPRTIPSILNAILDSRQKPLPSVLGSIRGGDTRLILNANRSRMSVRVTDGSMEARFGLKLPTEAYEIEVHNRVVDTNAAPFTPSIRSAGLLVGAKGLTCRPEPFPAGQWNITEICPRNDKYGPYMIKTNAVGKVAVYAPGPVEGKSLCIGEYEDAGYGIHANTVPFEYSKSYGCIVARSEDVARLARSLEADRRRDPDAEQSISVSRFCRDR
jgi:hypothetical protein